jgi:hypothetical protein
VRVFADKRKCTSRKRQTPRTAFGVRFSAETFYPGYAKNAYPGLICLHASGVASPKGCRELSPGWTVLCDTRGLDVREDRTPEGCKEVCWTIDLICSNA